MSNVKDPVVNEEFDRMRNPWDGARARPICDDVGG